MGFYSVLVFAGVFAVHHFLSTRNSVYWGAILPTVYIVFSIWFFATHHVTHVFQIILLLLLGLVFFLVDWEEGRKVFRAKRKKELQKMQSHDMK